MAVKEITAKSVLRKQKKIESWFLTRYGMNLYRGCAHNCVYCDGRSEKYQVEGEFGEDVKVKINAPEILQRELDPKRKRKPMSKGYVGLVGGVGDSYQPVEKKYELTKKALHIINTFNHPVHILTKSTLVERDLELIKEINEKKKTIVSFSLSSADDKISSIFEPGVPPPSERLNTLKKFKKHGINTGVYLLPVIPFITDKPEIIDSSLKKIKNAGVDFVIFGGMTLKDGRQKEYFIKKIKENYPELLTEYSHIYKDKKWGNAIPEYNKSLYQTFNLISEKHRIPLRIPPYLYLDVLDENSLVVVILEHLDYLLKLKGRKSPYSYAAFSISKLNEPLSELKFSLKKLKGVGPTTERLILEILNTGRCSYYEKLLLK